MSKPTYHITRSVSGKWAIKQEGARRTAIKKFDSQKEAILYVTKLAKTNRLYSIVVSQGISHRKYKLGISDSERPPTKPPPKK